MSKEKKDRQIKSEKLVAVKGMNDILPQDSARWEWLEEKVRNLMARYAYRNIRTPIVESTALFIRGLGQVTDIVEKEMYSFEDALNGDHLTLRPESTAGVVRAGGAILVEDNELTPEWVRGTLIPLLTDDAALAEMSARAVTAGTLDGTERLYDLVRAALEAGNATQA